MVLPPGPRAPASWQTIAWMARPGAFMRRSTIASATRSRSAPTGPRSRWCCSPTRTPCATCFALDPAIAPAGQSWEFLRPFAGPHSILLLDGDEHLRERRLLQTPFHGERMRAFAPMIAELARRELGSWRGRVVALERMRELTLEIILRVVFGARGERRGGGAARAIEGALSGVRSMPQMLAMALVRRDLGPHSPWGRFRVAVERFDAVLLDLLARRRAEPRGGGFGPGATARAARRGRQRRRPTATCATSSSRCSSAATTARPPRWRGRSSGWPATPRCTRACARAIRPTSTRSSRRCCAHGRR